MTSDKMINEYMTCDEMSCEYMTSDKMINEYMTSDKMIHEYMTSDIKNKNLKKQRWIQKSAVLLCQLKS